MSSSPAKRSKRYRQRQRDCVIVARVEVSFELIDALIDENFLAVTDSEDRPAIGRALGLAIHHWKETATRRAASGAESARQQLQKQELLKNA
jgi:hypothetical protein